MIAWTNPLPRIVKARAFLDGDYGPFEEYIDFYREDRAGQGYGPIRHVPSEYGYILFDFVDRRIASAQHYTTIDRVSRAEIQGATGERRLEIEKLVGLISHRFDTDTPAGPFTPSDIPSLSAYTDGAEMFASYRFELPGWRLAVSGGSESLREVYAVVRSIVILEPKDHQAWLQSMRPAG
ncbi:hypothetical protein G6L37_05640 [Agrobacterium rubi]|nr:hypothetical protein [Agrobacterium rubi]NTF24841.1 hypothetical protein [Agrobacterium rubi]